MFRLCVLAAEGNFMKKAAFKPMSLLSVLVWIGIWQIAAMVVSLPLILPSPLDTLRALISLGAQGGFWLSIAHSLVRIIGGFLAAVLAGIMLAVLCFKAATAELLLSPVRSMIRATPVSSFIILVLLWLGTDMVPFFISFLMVLPIIWYNMQEGMAQTSAELLEMAVAYDFTWRKKLKYIHIPSLLPYFYSSVAAGTGIAWKAGIAAEVIAKPELSIGKHLQDTKVYLLTDRLFAWTATIIMLSVLFEKLLKTAVAKAAGRRSRHD